MAWISERQYLVLLYSSLLPSHEAQHVLLNGSGPSWTGSLWFLQENTQRSRDAPSFHGQGSQTNANPLRPESPPAYSSFSFSTEKSRRNSQSFLRKTKKDSSSSVEPFPSPQLRSCWPPRWHTHTRPGSSGGSRDSWVGKPPGSHSAPQWRQNVLHRKVTYEICHFSHEVGQRIPEYVTEYLALIFKMTDEVN